MEGQVPGEVLCIKKKVFQTQERRATLVSSNQSWQVGLIKSQTMEVKWRRVCEITKGDSPDMLLTHCGRVTQFCVFLTR